MASAVPPARGSGGLLREALALLMSRRLLVPALALAILLTLSNIFVVAYIPPEGERPGLAFALAALIRIAGLMILAVAILRIMTDSIRRPFAPDAGFWLYALSFVAVTAISAAVRALVGTEESVGSIALVGMLVAVVTSPFAVWFAALTVERPVPWDPRPWLRTLGRWLLPYLFWSLSLVSPLAALHAAIDMKVLDESRGAFSPLLLVDGPLSAVMALLSMALIAAAYRRVARR